MPQLHVLLAVHVDTGFGRDVLRGLARFAREHPEQHFRWEQIPVRRSPRRILNRTNGEGLIANICFEQMVRAVQTSGIPTINIADSLGHVGLPQVLSDDHAVGRLGADHFLSRGLAHMAFFGLEGFHFSQRRQAGFAEALREAGQTCHLCPPNGELAQRWQWFRYTEHLDEWVASLPRPVGIMACMDFAARHVVDSALRVGLRVPEDVAVLGVDNDEVECEMAGVPISSVALGARRIGYHAAQLLVQTMQEDSPPPELTLLPPTRVVVRRSSDIFAVNDDQVRQALHFIHMHATKGIKVTDVLDAVPLSRRELERRFSRLLGRTPHDEIHRVRMERAKKLLAETELPMARIASACGLKESKRLCTVFRQEFCLSPSEYRRKFRGD